MSHRTILHVDMDAFYASVELLRRPELRGRPVVVGAEGSRGVVAAASYEARAFGVFSAMPSMRARRLCPDAVFLAGDHDHYAEVSARIMTILRSYTPLVEPLSLDEAFLDVTGSQRLHGPGSAIAAEIRQRILDEEGLTSSVGVATTKFLAKLATEEAKPRASFAGPVFGSGVHVVTPSDELAFLHPLPVRALWGVGPKTLAKLERIGVATVADLAALPEAAVTTTLGVASGRHLHQLANGIDDREVEPDLGYKSIGHEETFAVDFDDHAMLHVELVRMADAVAARARDHGVAGRTATIKVRFADFVTITRSTTPPQPVSDGIVLTALATEMAERIDISRGIRLFGVTLSNLVPLDGVVEQLHLDLGAGDVPVVDPRRRELTATVDALRARFGDDAVLPATLAGNGGLRPKRRGDQQWGPDRTA